MTTEEKHQIVVSFKVGKSNRYGLANKDDLEDFERELSQHFENSGWVFQDVEIKLK